MINHWYFYGFDADFGPFTSMGFGADFGPFFIMLRADHVLRPSAGEVRLHFSSISCIMML